MRQIFAIEWFHLIGTIIRSIAQNSMDKKLFEILTVEIVGIYTQAHLSIVGNGTISEISKDTSP